MDLAGAVSGAFAGVVAGFAGVHRRRESSREVGGTGSAAYGVRREADAGRSEPGDGIQDDEIWRV